LEIEVWFAEPVARGESTPAQAASATIASDAAMRVVKTIGLVDIFRRSVVSGQEHAIRSVTAIFLSIHDFKIKGTYWIHIMHELAD